MSRFPDGTCRGGARATRSLTATAAWTNEDERRSVTSHFSSCRAISAPAPGRLIPPRTPGGRRAAAAERVRERRGAPPRGGEAGSGGSPFFTGGISIVVVMPRPPRPTLVPPPRPQPPGYQCPSGGQPVHRPRQIQPLRLRVQIGAPGSGRSYLQPVLRRPCPCAPTKAHRRAPQRGSRRGIRQRRLVLTRRAVCVVVELPRPAQPRPQPHVHRAPVGRQPVHRPRQAQPLRLRVQIGTPDPGRPYLQPVFRRPCPRAPTKAHRRARQGGTRQIGRPSRMERA